MKCTFLNTWWKKGGGGYTIDFWIFFYFIFSLFRVVEHKKGRFESNVSDFKGFGTFWEKRRLRWLFNLNGKISGNFLKAGKKKKIEWTKIDSALQFVFFCWNTAH